MNWGLAVVAAAVVVVVVVVVAAAVAVMMVVYPFVPLGTQVICEQSPCEKWGIANAYLMIKVWKKYFILTFKWPGWYLHFSTWFVKNILFEQKIKNYEINGTVWKIKQRLHNRP